MVDPQYAAGSEAWFRAVLVDGASSELAGLDDDELAEMAAALPHPLPGAYVNFLRVAGKQAGRLWRGSDMFYPTIVDAVSISTRIAAESDPPFAMPEHATPLGHHQGYSFDYLDGLDDDPPVFRFTEGDQAAEQIADSFSAFVKRSIDAIATETERHLGAQRALVGQIFDMLTNLSALDDVEAPDDELAALVAQVVAGENESCEAIIERCQQRITVPGDLSSRVLRFYGRLETEVTNLRQALPQR